MQWLGMLLRMMVPECDGWSHSGTLADVTRSVLGSQGSWGMWKEPLLPVE